MVEAQSISANSLSRVIQRLSRLLRYH